MQSIDATLDEARIGGVEPLDAQVLLAHVLARSRTWLRAHGNEPMPSLEALDRFRQLCAQRRLGTPVAYLTGEREFYGLALRITSAVLDPRPDTEVLVDWALDCLRGPLAAVSSPIVADLGTGSGAIALAVAQHAPHACVLGLDRSAAALALAADNAKALGLRVDWRLGDWLGPLRGERGHLLISNPPYIAPTDPHLTALHAEPREALVAGEGGLADLRHITRHAGQWLLDGGWLLFEHGHDQGARVAELLSTAGFVAVSHRHDLAGHIRCTGGQWTGAR